MKLTELIARLQDIADKSEEDLRAEVVILHGDEGSITQELGSDHDGKYLVLS